MSANPFLLKENKKKVIISRLGFMNFLEMSNHQIIYGFLARNNSTIELLCNKLI